MTVTDWITAVSAAATALVAIVAAGFAYGQVREASELRKAQTRPYVVVYLESGEGSLAFLVIKNFGLTAAYSVRVQFDGPLKRAEGRDDPELASVKLPECIAVLAPGQEWRTFFDSSERGIAGSDFPATHNGTVTYEGRTTGPRPYRDPVTLDYEQFKGRLYTEPTTLKQINSTLKSIQRTMSGITAASAPGEAGD